VPTTGRLRGEHLCSHSPHISQRQAPGGEAYGLQHTKPGQTKKKNEGTGLLRLHVEFANHECGDSRAGKVRRFRQVRQVSIRASYRRASYRVTVCTLLCQRARANAVVDPG